MSPLTDLLSWDDINEIIERTKKGGAEIVGLLKDGSAYYAPAKAAALMVEAVLSDKKQIYPCAVMLDGEYGYTNTVSGVPVMIGANGAEKVIEKTDEDFNDLGECSGFYEESKKLLYDSGSEGTIQSIANR